MEHDEHAGLELDRAEYGELRPNLDFVTSTEDTRHDDDAPARPGGAENEQRAYERNTGDAGDNGLNGHLRDEHADKPKKYVIPQRRYGGGGRDDRSERRDRYYDDRGDRGGGGGYRHHGNHYHGGGKRHYNNGSSSRDNASNNSATSSSRNCSFCGSKLGGTKFCLVCGKAKAPTGPPVVCFSCNSYNPFDYKVCSACGTARVL